MFRDVIVPWVSRDLLLLVFTRAVSIPRAFAEFDLKLNTEHSSARVRESIDIPSNMVQEPKYSGFNF